MSQANVVADANTPSVNVNLYLILTYVSGVMVNGPFLLSLLWRAIVDPRIFVIGKIVLGKCQC